MRIVFLGKGDEVTAVARRMQSLQLSGVELVEAPGPDYSPAAALGNCQRMIAVGTIDLGQAPAGTIVELSEAEAEYAGGTSAEWEQFFDTLARARQTNGQAPEELRVLALVNGEGKADDSASLDKLTERLRALATAPRVLPRNYALCHTDACMHCIGETACTEIKQ